MNSPLKFLTARKILPLLDLLAKFKRVLTCLCSPNFCAAHKRAKQIFYFCSCSQKNRSVRHARECSQRPFVTPNIILFITKFVSSIFLFHYSMEPAIIVCLVIAFIFWLIRFARIVVHFFKLMEIRAFYKNALRITEVITGISSVI